MAGYGPRKVMFKDVVAGTSLSIVVAVVILGMSILGLPRLIRKPVRSVSGPRS